MRTPHGDYLIVTNPGGTDYFFVYPRLTGPTRKYSLVPGEAFKEIRTLKLPPGVRAVAWEYGRDTILEPVFTTPGKYVVRMGERMESDFAGKIDTCRVTVSGTTK